VINQCSCPVVYLNSGRYERPVANEFTAVLIDLLLHVGGTAVAQWLRCCATSRKVAGSIPAGVSAFFIDIKSFLSHYDPEVDSVSNINEYQEYFLGGKGGGCVRLTTLPPSCAVVTKSGSLNFLEPSGPVQACNGTALPLPFTFARLLLQSSSQIYLHPFIIIIIITTTTTIIFFLPFTCGTPLRIFSLYRTEVIRTAQSQDVRTDPDWMRQ